MFVPGVPATDCDSSLTGTVRSLGEGIQADDGLLADCFRAGVTPSAVVTVTSSESSYLVSGPTGSVTLDAHLAAQLFVAT
jgi:hypothetical protein